MISWIKREYNASVKKMNDNKRMHFEVLKELRGGYRRRLNDDSIQKASLFYYFDRPYSDKQFWGIVEKLQKKGYLAQSSLQTIEKYKEKTPTIHFKASSNIPATKEADNPMSVKGKAYLEQLRIKKAVADTSWHNRVEPILSLVKEGWVGKALIGLLIILIGLITKDFWGSVVFKAVRNYILND